MHLQSHLFCKPGRSGDFDGRSLFLLTLLTFLLITQAAWSQTIQHVTNPYPGAVNYLNPDYTAEVQTAIAAQPAGSTLVTQMAVTTTYPTAVWLDHIGAISGGAAAGGRMSLQQHINTALVQQANSTINPSGEPILVELVIDDLPGRNCEALSSNGELSIAGGDTVIGPGGAPVKLTGTGLQEYEHDYIMPIFNTLQAVAGNPNIRFVLVVENDSLTNLIINVGESPNAPIAACVAANGGVSGAPSLTSVYVQGIQFALNEFHQLPNVYTYLDVGHHGLLGCIFNFQDTVNFLTAVARGTTAGLASVDGFITNTANYGPTREPLMTATEMIGGNTVISASFYHFDPFIDEESYAAAMDQAFILQGFPATLGFLIDTSRNGWGSPLRPSTPSTSNDVNTFVNASRIDLRTDMDQWCNQPNAGMGVPPTVNPGGFANLSAFVWIKPPGESDGNYPGSMFNGVTSTTGDPNCNPTHDNALANNQPTDAVPNSPPEGAFWIPYYTMLVRNAFPPIRTEPPGLFLSLTPTSLTLNPGGPNVTDSVTISATTGPVSLAVLQLPAGVSASFSPNLMSAGTTVLSLSAADTALVGNFTVIVTATAGTQTVSAPLALAVVAKAPPPPTCHIGYTIVNQWNTGFQAALSINNTGTTDINGWSIAWSFADGQTITQLWNGQETQSGQNVTVHNMSYNASIPAGGSYGAAGFTASWNGSSNSIPTAFSLNGVACQ